MERLNQKLMEKKKKSRSGMVIKNLLQKEGRQRGTWNGKKADNDFYKKIVDAYEAKNQELAVENANLRALLPSMQADMPEFLNAPNESSKQSTPISERLDQITCSPLWVAQRYGLCFKEPKLLISYSMSCLFNDMKGDPSVCNPQDVFDLPLHMARDQIEESLRNKMASIKLQDAQNGADVNWFVPTMQLQIILPTGKRRRVLWSREEEEMLEEVKEMLIQVCCQWLI